MEKDFSKWLYLKIDWAEVLYLYNTGKKYQKKQDLVALFWNSYIYVEFKVKDYFSKFSELPLAELNNLIFEFRQNFPLSDRIKGINYYDDLIYLLIEKYSSPQPIETQPESTPPKLQTIGKTNVELSVPDWTIIFYYLDEAGTKEGNKIDRMEKFIEKNNVINPSGTLTTKSNFKKEYHEIENRINGKNGKKPLPPQRIKTILSYLESDTNALQRAKNDIVYLTEEKE
ncbi:hypothetical protein [Sunxiuqinia elliptica]|uniref:Uncharacterized protein n=1 Tax=Sunxiuqinia elliptica TaxID=655355 RepID=A0A4R6GX07_9BACT|nr:hypothetical protein [Sunxiuqinia elliptica]TDN99986.1 hypothetical protein DET52_106199 [Sunxiuqinia elliptica]TDO57178.1 hypothetical protein DET65_3763 [Sunxiuqinia elliptica]